MTQHSSSQLFGIRRRARSMASCGRHCKRCKVLSFNSLKYLRGRQARIKHGYAVRKTGLAKGVGNGKCKQANKQLSKLFVCL